MAEEVEKEERVGKVMEGVGSIALLPSGSISGHFVHLPNSVCYGFYGTEIACERECSRGEDYRLIKLTITDYNSKRERDVVVECRGHDAARLCNVDHAHGWEKDVVGMLDQKHGKRKVYVSFDCETLKAEGAAEDHIRKFMPKLAGMDAVVNIGPMSITGLEFDKEDEEEQILQNVPQ
ncbi:Tubulin glycylase [Heracleum sosnowskyi]|uniref:Tubulin glycylase n=1 Tax=Heracleum sosnowskyi TaxID=360622 RepID=A0AAD8GQQ4_9APIA|nr:Tubulin glycylase [Heracleum sosnowskyi]